MHYPLIEFYGITYILLMQLCYCQFFFVLTSSLKWGGGGGGGGGGGILMFLFLVKISKAIWGGGTFLFSDVLIFGD